MKQIAVTGLGKVGSLVGTLLSDQFTVTGLDQHDPTESQPFKTVKGGTTDPEFLKAFLKDKDAVVSCLPFHLNLSVKLQIPRDSTLLKKTSETLTGLTKIF